MRQSSTGSLTPSASQRWGSHKCMHGINQWFSKPGFPHFLGSQTAFFSDQVMDLPTLTMSNIYLFIYMYTEYTLHLQYMFAYLYTFGLRCQPFAVDLPMSLFVTIITNLSALCRLLPPLTRERLPCLCHDSPPQAAPTPLLPSSAWWSPNPPITMLTIYTNICIFQTNAL